MANANDLLKKLLELEAQINELKSRIVISGDQVRIVEGLSDIDGSLGTITAGEFRAGVGTPGHGFTGTRIAYPPMRYNTKFWHIAGVDNDEIQWGANSTSGKIMAGAGAVTMDALGIRVRTQGIANYARRPMAVWHPGDSLELAMRIRDPALSDCENAGDPLRLANLVYRSPGSTSTYPFWSLEFKEYCNDTTVSTDVRCYETDLYSMPTSAGYGGIITRIYTGQVAASDNRTEVRLQGPTTDTPAQLYMLTKTQEMKLTDADTTSASAEGWIEVEIGGNVSYIRTYGTK